MGNVRTVPPEWTADLYAGDLWAAVTASLAAWSSTWEQLPADETWAEQVGTWEDDLYAEPVALEVLGGTLASDVAGAAARTTGTVVLPADQATLAAATVGQWIQLVGHLCAPAEAPADGNPASVPATALGTLWVVGADHDPAEATLTLACEDLVTILGQRVLTPTSGTAVGYLPAARTVIGVIRELVDVFGPAFATVPTTTVPDTPWAPAVDRIDSRPVPLAGNAWQAIESMCELGGLVATADGPRLHLAATVTQPAHSGLTVSATPDVPGIQTLPGSRRMTAPAVTRVIATAQDSDGRLVIGTARDTALAAEQGFDVDEQITVNALADTTTLTVAAQARLTYSRTIRDTGSLTIPWLPVLNPGDLVTVAWTPSLMRTYFIDSVTVPLDPTDPVLLAIRGPALARWQDEPPGEPWSALDPALTWAEDI